MRLGLSCSLLLLALVGAAAASPAVRIKARPQIFDLTAQNTGDAVRVRGTLRDDRGQPLPNAALEIVVGDQLARIKTGPDGRFSAALTVAGTGPVAVDVRYAGGPLTGAVAANTRVYAGKFTVDLSVQLAPEIPAQQPQSIVVQARDQSGHAAANLQLAVNVDESSPTRLVTGADGRAAFSLPGLPPGAHRLTLVAPGDRRRAPARLERRFVAARPMQISLDPALRPAPGDPVVISGAVVGGEEVTASLVVDGRVVARRPTEGRFRFVVDDLEPGEHSAFAMARAEAPGWREARSNDVQFSVPAAPPRSALWTFAPLGLVALAVVGAWARRRPRPRPEPPRIDSAPPPPVDFVLASAATDLALTVVDRVSGRPVRARVVALASAPERCSEAAVEPPGPALETDATGRLRLAERPGWLWIHAPGYAPSIVLPPARAQRATVRLSPLRAHLQALFSDLLVDAGRPPLRFGRETPQEAAAALRERGADDASVDPLTAVIEAACFGPRPPTPADHARVLSLSAQVRARWGA